MDGSVDGIGSSAPVSIPTDNYPPQGAPETPQSEAESPPVAEDSGKTLDLYV